MFSGVEAELQRVYAWRRDNGLPVDKNTSSGFSDMCDNSNNNSNIAAGGNVSGGGNALSRPTPTAFRQVAHPPLDQQHEYQLQQHQHQLHLGFKPEDSMIMNTDRYPLNDNNNNNSAFSMATTVATPRPIPRGGYGTGGEKGRMDEEDTWDEDSISIERAPSYPKQQHLLLQRYGNTTNSTTATAAAVMNHQQRHHHRHQAPSSMINIINIEPVFKDIPCDEGGGGVATDGGWTLKDDVWIQREDLIDNNNYNNIINHVVDSSVCGSNSDKSDSNSGNGEVSHNQFTATTTTTTPTPLTTLDRKHAGTSRHTWTFNQPIF